MTINNLIELQHFKRPPQLVSMVMEGLCCLLGERQRWGPQQRLILSNAHVLLRTLSSIRCDRIPSTRLTALAKRLDSEGMTPAAVRSASTAAFALFQWLVAVREWGEQHALSHRAREAKGRLKESNTSTCLER
ncbi:unnamed protein product [Discosporangium mesarthrocarpum]